MSWSKRKKCPRCCGKGTTTRIGQKAYMDSPPNIIEEPCVLCNGSGRVGVNSEDE